jgi:hypothetical protein
MAAGLDPDLLGAVENGELQSPTDIEEIRERWPGGKARRRMHHQSRAGRRMIKMSHQGI